MLNNKALVAVFNLIGIVLTCGCCLLFSPTAALGELSIDELRKYLAERNKVEGLELRTTLTVYDLIGEEVLYVKLVDQPRWKFVVYSKERWPEIFKLVKKSGHSVRAVHT